MERNMHHCLEIYEIIKPVWTFYYYIKWYISGNLWLWLPSCELHADGWVVRKWDGRLNLSVHHSQWYANCRINTTTFFSFFKVLIVHFKRNTHKKWLIVLASLKVSSNVLFFFFFLINTLMIHFACVLFSLDHDIYSLLCLSCDILRSAPNSHPVFEKARLTQECT